MQQVHQENSCFMGNSRSSLNYQSPFLDQLYFHYFFSPGREEQITIFFNRAIFFCHVLIIKIKVHASSVYRL
jgi:hypothetical protein